MIDIAFGTGQEIIERQNFEAFREQTVAEMGSNKAGGAGHEYAACGQLSHLLNVASGKYYLLARVLVAANSLSPPTSCSRFCASCSGNRRQAGDIETMASRSLIESASSSLEAAVRAISEVT